MDKKNQAAAPKEIWRECYDVTDAGRLFVSSDGNVRFQPTIHHDEKTGRPYVLINSCPVFLDSLVLSMFGDSPRPRRCYDISHVDDNPDNCSLSNLEWTSIQLRDRDNTFFQQSSDTNLSYIISRTLTPEMVKSREYPIVERTSAQNAMMIADLVGVDRPDVPALSSPPNPTLESLAREIDDLRSLLRSPASRDVLMKRFSGMIADEICARNRTLDVFRDVCEEQDTPEKYMKRIYIPPGYTVVRRQQDDGTFAWYRVSEEAMSLMDSLLGDVRKGMNPLRDYEKKWRPFGKPQFEYLGDYIFDGNEISDYIDSSDMKQDNAEQDGGRPLNSSEVKDIDRNRQFPQNTRGNSGQVDVQSRFNMKQEFSSDRKRRPAESQGDVRNASVNKGSQKFSPEEEYMDMSGCLDAEPVPEITEPEKKVYSVLADRIKKVRNYRPAVRELGMDAEELEKLAEGLKQMTAQDFRDLGLRNGNFINLESSHPGKPVIVTDMRNMREFYCESVTKCAQLLGVNVDMVSKCVRGKVKQIGNYQVRLKNGLDGIMILKGIYGEYMKMLEEKRAEMSGKDEEEKIQREMDDINAQIEQMMQEKSEKIDNETDV